MQFNVSPFNTGQFNGVGMPTVVYSSDRLVFDGFSLSDGVRMKLGEFPDSGPPRDFIGGKLPSGDGGFVTDIQDGELVVTSYGILYADTIADLETRMDGVKKRLRTKGAFLDHTQADGTVKRYVATLSNPDELFSSRRFYHTTYVPWVAKFRCPYPYGVSRTYLSELESFTQVDSPYTKVITHAGTADARPVFILIFNSATDITAVNLQRIDPDDGSILEEIEYSGSIAANDVLEFNSEDYAVRLNSAKVVPVGGFLTMAPDANIFKVTITGTSFSVDATIKHKTTFR